MGRHVTCCIWKEWGGEDYGWEMVGEPRETIMGSAFNRYLERIQLLNAGKKEAGVALL